MKIEVESQRGRDPARAVPIPSIGYAAQAHTENPSGRSTVVWWNIIGVGSMKGAVHGVRKYQGEERFKGWLLGQDNGPRVCLVTRNGGVVFWENWIP